MTTWVPPERRNLDGRPPGSCSRTTGGSSRTSGRASRGSSEMPETMRDGTLAPEVLPLNRGRTSLLAFGVSMALPISAALPLGGFGGPRGEPPGPVVLPPRVRGEPDGGPLRRRSLDRLRTEALGRRAALRGRQDVARPYRRHDLRRDPRRIAVPAVSAPRPFVLVVFRLSRNRPHRFGRPGLRRPPRRPRRCVPQAADASAARREGVRPRPVRLRRGRPPPEPRDSLLVRPAIFHGGRVAGGPRHHR